MTEGSECRELRAGHSERMHLRHSWGAKEHYHFDEKGISYGCRDVEYKLSNSCYYKAATEEEMFLTKK